MIALVRGWQRCARHAAALLLTGLVGCVGQAGGRATQVTNAEQFISGGWILGQTRADIRARLGVPLAMHVDRIENRHTPGQIDEYHVFRYEGLTLGFYVVKADAGREFLTDVSVTDSRYKLGQGLSVGIPRDDVIHLLGDKFVPLSQPVLRRWMPPAAPECGSDVCTYKYTDGYSYVYFSFKDGHVSRVDWMFDLD